MKIACVVGGFPRLSETFILEQITRLLELGHDVRVFAFESGTDAVRHPAIEAYRLLERTSYIDDGHLAQRGWAGPWSRQPQRDREGAFDVIHCHFGHVAERARRLVAAGFFSGPLVATLHAWDMTVLLRERGEGYYTRLFAEAACLLPISRRWQSELLRLGADSAKVRVLHMGVDCDRLRFRTRELGENEPLRVASIGRLIEKKGIVYGLEALRLARPKLGREVEYHVVGDGELRASLEAEARRLDVFEQVTFHGSLASDRTAALLDRMHLLMAPSVTSKSGDMEGIPVALMEGMALGLPVLATRHAGIPELVEDGTSGYLVPERDAGALGERLLELGRHPERWPTLAEAGRRTIEAEFDAKKLALELEQVLTGVAHARTARSRVPPRPVPGRVLFVADEFAAAPRDTTARYPGGAEQTDEAVIQRCPWPIERLRIDEVEPERLEGFDLIVVGNVDRARPDQLRAIARLGRHVLFEHDYRMCRYRGSYTRLKLHRWIDRCICPQERFGEIFASARGAVFLTRGQLRRYLDNPVVRLPVHSILGSSVMDRPFFDAVERYRRNPAPKNGTLVVGNRFRFKGVGTALAYCKRHQLEPTLLQNASPKELLHALERAERLVFMPEWFEPASRLVVEARFLGCQVVTNDRVGVVQEPWWKAPDDIGLAILRGTADRFWSLVLELWTR